MSFSGTECISKPWLACRTRFHFERILETQCKANAIEAYVPWVRNERNWNNRKVLIETPLIPGYVFFRADPRAVQAFRGLVQIFKLAVQEQELEILAQACKSYQMSGGPQSIHDFKIGDRVSIIAGPFYHQSGIVKDSSRRLVKVGIQTSLNRLGISELVVQIPADELIAQGVENAQT
jgi:transcriptional antiterminator NusG